MLWGMTKDRKGPQRSITQDHRGSLLVLRHRTVSPWSTTTTQFLSRIWTVQDSQVAIIAWQRENSVLDALPLSSQRWRQYFWWLGRRMKFPCPQIARSASAYWLAIRQHSCAASQLGPAACVTSIAVSTWERDLCFHKHCWSIDFNWCQFPAA